jgi:hypothetical protein
MLHSSATKVSKRTMGSPCYRHPKREGSFYCQKDGNYMCRDCACCHTPRVYCQFRTACVIHLLTKEGQLQECSGNKPDAETAGGTDL